MQNLVLLAVGAFFVWFVSRIITAGRRTEEEAPPEHYDTAELSDALHHLVSLSDQLANVDRMLADLDACDPSSLVRGFRTQWCGIDGNRRTIDFLTDGQNLATAGLRQAAQEQRDAINAQIILEVRALGAALDSGQAPALNLDAVGKTMDETTGPATVGEW